MTTQTIGQATQRKLPTGTVTFLFSDVENSTGLIERHGAAAHEALAKHHRILADAVAAHRGHVFNIVGDGTCSAFAAAPDAVAAAMALQRALHAASFADVGEVRIRVGVHTGEADAAAGDYVSSLALVRAQRIMAAGHGGQTLLSATTADGVRGRLPPRSMLRDLGLHKLRGLAQPEVIFELFAADLPSAFPPLRVEQAHGDAATDLLQDLVRGRLVGRAGELEQLREHWRQAAEGRGHLVLLSGEPGIGKTRLAQEIIDHARQAGAALMRGGCYEYEAMTPYLPFIEAFRQFVRDAGADRLRTLLGTTATEIAKLAPEVEAKLGALPANATLSPNEERLRLFDNVARFLQAVAAGRGLLLFIDDLHWADQGTLSMLQYLMRNLRGDRVLILGAYREIELDRAHPLARALVDWNRDRLAWRIALARLSHEHTSTLLATLFSQDTVSPAFAAALYRETEGNPFFVEEVVKSLIERGEIYRSDGEWNRNEARELTLPQSVKEAIGHRLDRLSDGAADALRTAAALGKVFSFRDLAAVVAASEDDLLDALDEAQRAQLIRAGLSHARAGGSDSFVFTPDKIREVLYEEQNPIRRRRLHQRIGEVLERLHAAGGDANEQAQDLAHHFTQAGDLVRSLAYLQLAAARAERLFAYDEAVSYLEQAREAADALQRPADIAAIDERIGDVHVARGTIQPAIEHYERALDATASASARAALKVKVGTACTPIGDPHGLVRLEEALAELDPATQPAARALATALVGRYHHYAARHVQAIEFLQRARELAEPLADASVLGNVYAFLAGAFQHVLRYSESDRWARACIALGESGRFPEGVANGYEFLSENASGRGHWTDAIRYADLDLAHGRRIGSLSRIAWSGFGRAQGYWGRGELATARDTIADALALCEQTGEARLATWLEAFAATTLADLGDAEGAARHAQRGIEHARRLDQAVLTAWTQNSAGYASLVREDIAEAMRWYDQCLPLLEQTCNVARLLVAGRAADALLRAGRLEDAARCAELARDVATTAEAPHYLGLARQVQGRVLAARGRMAEARVALDEALALLTPIESRLEMARTLFHRAELEASLGDREAARSDASHARVEFAAMRAGVDEARAGELSTR